MIKCRYLLALLLPFALISLFVGVGNMSWQGLLNGQMQDWQIFWTSRFPRLMAIVVAGAGLNVCGLIMQTLTRNRFVSPTTAGLYDCARLGVLVSIILIPTASIFLKTGFAIGVTLLGALAFIGILSTLKHRDTVFVPLVGMIFGSIISAFTTFIALQMDLLQSLSGWLQGDFSTILNGQYELIYFSVPILGVGSRFGLIHDLYGFSPADPAIKVGTHGMSVSHEFISEKNPDYLFVIDRNAAITDGNSGAKKVLDNNLINQTNAAKNGNIVFLDSSTWYLMNESLGGMKAMVKEVSAAVE